MMSKTITSKAVRWALFAGASVTVAAPVLAADDGSDLERIEVTGSRIKRTDMETASPVSIISAKDLSRGSYTSVADVLAQSTFSAGAPTGSSTNNGGEGVSRVDLRGMGEARTLVLVNGRRMVNSGSGADAAVDLGSIPVAMIERIEVLKDGASAVYGSDAVAGVVNIITKKDFEGLQFDASYGGTTEGDANTGEISMLLGGSFDRGNVVIGASYVDRGRAKQSNRDWSKCVRDKDAVGACGDGSSIIPSGAVNAGIDLDGDGNNDYMELDPATGQWVKQTSDYDYVPYQYLSTPQERMSIFGSGHYEVTDETQIFTEFFHTKRTSEQMLAPSPVSGLTIKAGATGNIWGRDVVYKRRMSDAGTRDYEQTVDTTRFVLGAQGYLDIHNGLDWDVSYTWGRNDAVSKVHNLQNTAKLIETTDPALCGDGVPCGDWFVPEGQLSQDVLDYVNYTDQSTGGNEMNVIAGNISGDLFELPAGFVGFAGGAEYRRESGFFQPDSVTVAGDSAQSQQDPTSGSYDTTQVYTEFAIPLLSDIFLVKDLSMEAAIRYFDYSTFGDDTTWKLGLTWRLNDDIMLRGVKSTAFRAPTVSELYGGAVGSFDYLTDPCTNFNQADPSSTRYQTCQSELGGAPNYVQPDDQIENVWTADTDLKPEQAETLTLGAVWSPSFVNGLSATVDYYEIKVTDAITRIDGNLYLSNCYDGVQSACDALNIERNPLTGDIDYMTRPLTNVGEQKSTGVDLNVRYAFDALGLGWAITWDTSYLDSFKQDGREYAGTISGENGAYAEWKHNANLSLSGESWDASWRVRYIDGMKDLEQQSFETDAVIYNDVSGSYHFGDNATVTLGIDNLFDQDPEFLPHYSNANTVPEAYDVLGRYVYAKLSWRI
ncbi:TonB-dependent receptor plug domain-containing protein [Gallaecimonas xiamenensis]|uniref:TonB-dependent receptor n=1 Tax=Gallaecimonas xiamenensis 3-C-1 TaxID=745411 RepID=K2J106_9GAMM|nr:TonB-dependent receptor [Gallaecimonas xiamenensis]EKE68748.1 TonB-dependent receptor [Gallaecimonas xiamenensis 3-C-1]